MSLTKKVQRHIVALFIKAAWWGKGKDGCAPQIMDSDSSREAIEEKKTSN